MALADSALLESLKGHPEAALALYHDAFLSEREAAHAARAEKLGEPTMSVLFRSAATLALDAQEVREAERLVAIALSMEPPNDIAEELRDLLEKIHFSRHVELRGLRLNPAEFQFAMIGPAVGFGIVRSEEFVERVHTVETVLYRTAERQLGKPYRDAGKRSKALQEEVAVYVSVPRAASFAVTFKLGLTTQLSLFENERTFADTVIDEVLSCFEILDRRDDDSIRKRISDPAYLNNFVGLAQKVAPDGKRITGVGFTTARADGVSRQVELRRRATDIRPPAQPPGQVDVAAKQIEARPVTITGRLRFASELEQKNEIRLEPDDGTPIAVHVPEGLMSDIVKPLWGERVTMEGTQRGNEIWLTRINRAE